jgi:FKBP-type peptidyl-prolyl cis-trans isomerase FkpA
MSTGEKYPDTSTSRPQRIAIWVIAIVMVGGTLVSFLIYAIASMNPSVNSDQIIYDKAVEKYQQEQADQAAQKAGYQVFLDGHEAAPFDPAGVGELSVVTIREGDGAEALETDTITANYTGWSADGVIFDTTKRSVDADLLPVAFPLNQVITGWTAGLTGKKAGGIYELTIPADMAYGEGSGENSYGQPLGPLKFIVEIVSIDTTE